MSNDSNLPLSSGDEQGLGRRNFLGLATALTAATTLVGAVSPVQAAALGPLSPGQRRQASYQLRVNAAQSQRLVPIPPHPTNGDETLYPNKIGNFSKGLPHNSLGEVSLSAYNSLLFALNSGRPNDFENIQITPGGRKLTNPQAGLAYDLEGTDSHQLDILPAPALASAETAGEMVELYWHAVLRDVPFDAYATHPDVLAAVADLNTLSNFKGPRAGGLVTPQTLFRGNVAYVNPADPTGKTGIYYTPPGVTVGPYLSQYLWLDTPFGVESVNRRMRTVTPVDFMTTFSDWLTVQNGLSTGQALALDTPRYLINGRDLGEWVHIDVLFQAYFDACLILLSNGTPLNVGNPYNTSKTQIGFGTLGAPAIIGLVCEVATRALKAVWFTKWFVHRRLRPEAYGGLVYGNLSNGKSYPLHPEVFNSDVLTGGYLANGLLPMAFPEGSPTHPAYGAGHATVAGACVTILKALFNENTPVFNPKMPDPSDPTQLIPYSGPALTVGGELNKLACNVAIGRNIAGVHWRSDAASSLALGEAIAISLLRDQHPSFNETFSGFTFTKFDGTSVTV